MCDIGVGSGVGGIVMVDVGCVYGSGVGGVMGECVVLSWCACVCGVVRVVVYVVDGIGSVSGYVGDGGGCFDGYVLCWHDSGMVLVVLCVMMVGTMLILMWMSVCVCVTNGIHGGVFIDGECVGRLRIVCNARGGVCMKGIV